MTNINTATVLDANYVNAETLPWIPTGLGSMEMMVCKVNPIMGKFVVLVRFPADGSPVPYHKHHGTVIVYTVSGKWGYKEDTWISGSGDVVYEPACSTHTPINYPEFGEVITFVIIDGALILDDQGKTLSILNAEAALELAPLNVRVNCICPGTIDTPMVHQENADTQRAIYNLVTPLGRFGRPEEVAGLVHFLSSDDASFITGQSVIDGGLTTGISHGNWTGA